jgi:hypothetical protein
VRTKKKKDEDGTLLYIIYLSQIVFYLLCTIRMTSLSSSFYFYHCLLDGSREVRTSFNKYNSNRIISYFNFLLIAL